MSHFEHCDTVVHVEMVIAFERCRTESSYLFACFSIADQAVVEARIRLTVENNLGMKFPPVSDGVSKSENKNATRQWGGGGIMSRARRGGRVGRMVLTGRAAKRGWMG